LADVEFEFSLARLARHRIVAGGSVREGKPCVLARRKGERIAADDGEPNTVDVVSGVLDRFHAAIEPAARMGCGLFVATNPRDGRIRSWDRTTGEDQPLRLLFLREREAAVIEKIDRTADEARFAGRAPAGAGSMLIHQA